MSNNERSDKNRPRPSSGTQNQNRRRHFHPHRQQNGVPKSGQNPSRPPPTALSKTASIDEHKMCICCLHELITYVYYSCMHYVCLQCSAKMRIVCQKLDCPVCRQHSDNVIGTKELLHTTNESKAGGCTETEAKANNQKDFDTYINKFKERPALLGGFYYTEEPIKAEFNALISHQCTLCQAPTFFDTFDDLYTHLKREHKRFYCDLCIENLKLFTFERKFYTREELATHRRQGDPNDKSFKGHPLCKYCDERFFDRDDLYRHMRKEHFFCHFCDADGCEEYYANYAGLRKHFLQSHFLCEEDECAPRGDMRNVREYVVFRREIDLQAHRVQKHAKNKSEAKALGKLNIEFNYTNDARAAPSERRNRRDRDAERGRNANLRGQYENYESERRPETQSPPQVVNSSAVNVAQEAQINISGFEPLVSTISDQAAGSSAHWRNVIANGPAPKLHQEQDFPSLGGNGDAPKSYVFQSLSALGKSIEKNSVWAKKNEPKKETVEKKAKVEKSVKKEEVPTSQMIDLKSYLSKQKERETSVQIGKKKDEDVVEKGETKSRKNKVKKEGAAPPPGFSQIEPQADETAANLASLLTQSSISSPPPGFATPSMLPENYRKGANYEARNQELANRLNEVFTRDKFEKFKQLSSQFRQSSIDAFEYLDRCRKEFFEPHSEDFRKFIEAVPDMVALLPSIAKQNELYDAFVTMSDAHKSKFRKLSKCHHCDQLMFTNELTAHINAYHAPKSEITSINEEFPTLDGGKSVAKTLAKVVNDDFPALGSTKKPTLSSIVDEFPSMEPAKSLKKAVEMNVIEDFPPLSSGAAHRSTYSDVPSFHQQESLIFNNPKENLSLVNKKKNRYRKFLK